MPHNKHYWIVVADAGRACMFSHRGMAEGVEPVEGGILENRSLHRHARDAKSDRPGRAFDSVGHARHSIEPTSDPHRQEEEAFAGTVAAFLAEKLAGRHFDQLIIVAPPRFLGDLRRALDPAVAKHVVKEVAHDLLKLPSTELVARLREYAEQASRS